MRVCPRGSDLCDTVPGVEHAGRFDDRRHRAIGRGDPRGRVQRLGRGRQILVEFAQETCERMRIRVDDRLHARQAERAVERRGMSFSGNQDRHNGMPPAAGMKILQVEGVILHLFAAGRVEQRCADLELENEDRGRRQHDSICPPAESKQRILQQYPGVAHRLFG